LTTPSQVPVRYPSGVTPDYSWGPLANCGAGNPFFYQTLYDDFFGLFTVDGPWTGVTSGTGAAIANVSGDGGQISLTGGTTVNLSAGIIGQKNTFFLPPALYTGSGLTSTLYPSKKVFFLARVNITTVNSVVGVVGLIPTTYTTGTPTDGIFFNLTSGTAVTVTAYSASTLQWTVTIPASLLVGGASAVYGNALWVDMGFYIDRLQNVFVFFGYPLVGWVPASAWTGSNANTALPPALGAVAAYQTGVSGTWTPTTAGLAPAAFFTGSAQVSYLDFIMASKER
jgi:hypothetical protein